MQGDLPNSSETRRFAEELLAKIPGTKAGGPSSYQQAERAQALLARRNARYSVLMDEDDNDEDAEPPPAPTTSALPSRKQLRRAKVKSSQIMIVSGTKLWVLGDLVTPKSSIERWL